MTNSYTPAAIKLMSKLTLPQFDAVKFYAARIGAVPMLSNHAPRRSTVNALARFGVLEASTYTHMDGHQIEFFKLTPLGYELAEQIGALGKWERHARLIALTAAPVVSKGDRVILDVAGREVAAEVARVIDSRTFHTYERSPRGYWGEFARDVRQVTHVERGAVQTAAAL